MLAALRFFAPTHDMIFHAGTANGLKRSEQSYYCLNMADSAFCGSMRIRPVVCFFGTGSGRNRDFCPIEKRTFPADTTAAL